MLAPQGIGSNWRSGTDRPAAARLRSGEKSGARNACRAGEKGDVGRVAIRNRNPGAHAGARTRSSARANVVAVALAAKRLNLLTAGLFAHPGLAITRVSVSGGAG